MGSIQTMVRRMTPARYTVKEAAALVGRSPDTLVRWRRSGRFVPSDRQQIGRLLIWLYTDEDIEEMKQLAKELRPGRRSDGYT